MSWVGQVWHVLKKDVRQAGWALVLLLGILASAMADALEVTLVPTWVESQWAFLFAGAIVTALLVQEDSPSRSDAFWVTRPLRPSAVLGAKLLLVGTLVLAIPLAAQLVVLIVHGAPAERIPTFLLASSIVPVGFVTAAAAVAALTPDLRTFLVVGTLAFFAALFGFQHLARALGDTLALRLDTHGWTAWSILLPTLALGVTAFQYRARDAARTLRLFAVPAVMVLVLSAAHLASPPAMAPPPEHLRAHQPEVELMELDVPGPGGGSRLSRLVLAVEVPDAPYDHRYSLPEWRVAVHPFSGEVMALSNAPRLALNAFRPRLSGFEWVGEARHLPSRYGASVALSDEAAVALAEGGGRVVVEGRVEILEPVLAGRLPLGEGAVRLDDGRNFRITEVRRHEGSVALHGLLETFEGGPVPNYHRWQYLDFALVNPSLGESILMDSREGLIDVQALVLPGIQARRIPAWIEPAAADPEAPLPRIAEEWLRDAELVIIAWRPIGGYPTRSEVDVDPTR